MKLKVNEEEVFELNPVKCKVICNDIHGDEFEADMKRRVRYIIEHKYEQCLKRLKAEWEPKLKANGVRTIPLDDDEFAELVFAQANYQDRKAREMNEPQ